MTTTNQNQSLQRQQGGTARDLGALLNDKKAALEKMAGGMLDGQRMVSLALLATQKTPALLACALPTILSSLMDAARLGLEPDGRQGAIIPFKGKAQFVPMVGGLIVLAYRDPALETVEAVTVYDCDEFRFKLGTRSFIDHTPALDRPEGAKAIAWYCVTQIRGHFAFDIMGPTEIEAIRKRSPAVKLGFSSPWDTDYDQMACKTVLKRRLKRVPSQSLLRAALDHDDEIDGGNVEIAAKATTTKTAGKVAAALGAGDTPAPSTPPCDLCGGESGAHEDGCPNDTGARDDDAAKADGKASAPALVALLRAIPNRDKDSDGKRRATAMAAAKSALGEKSHEFAVYRAVAMQRAGAEMGLDMEPLRREGIALVEGAGGFVE